MKKEEERPPAVDVEDRIEALMEGEDPIIYGRQWASNLTKKLPDKVTYDLVPATGSYWYLVPTELRIRFDSWLIRKDVENFPVWAFCIKAN